MSQKFEKIEKLKSEKLISQLFSEGRSVSKYPLKLIYLKSNFKNNIKCKVGVSVSKRNFKNAVDRNYIKRLLREGYRLNKSQIFNNTDEQYAFMILYIGKNQPDYNLINNKLKLLFGKFYAIIAKDKNP